MLFCRDGVLRHREWIYDRRTKSGRHVLLPLHVLEGHHPRKFEKQLTYGVEFEDGLTVREFFLNLKPWADLLVGIACMDFPAFVAEVEKPLAADAHTDLSHIEIYASASLEAKPAFEREGDLFDNMTPIAGGRLYRWNSPTPKITDRLEFEHSWGYSAYYKEKQVEDHGDWKNEYDHCSVSYCPLTRWHHLPIRFAPKMTVYDEAGGVGADYLTVKEPLFNPNHPWVKTIRTDDGRLVRHELEVDAPTPTFMDAIVRGFLWDVGFHYSPAQRDEMVEDLIEKKDDLDSVYDPYRDPETGEIDWDAVENDPGPAEKPEPEPEDGEDDDRNHEFIAKMAAVAYCEERAPDLVRWSDPE